MGGGGVSGTPVSALLVTCGWCCQVKRALGSDLTRGDRFWRDSGLGSKRLCWGGRRLPPHNVAASLLTRP